MGLVKAFKKEISNFKGKTPSEGFAFFWKYYKWHAIIWTIGLILLVNFLYHKLTESPTLLNGIMLNTADSGESADALAEEFLKLQNVDSSTYTITFDGSLTYIPGDKSAASDNYASSQAILSQTEEGELDFVAGPLSSMQDIAYNSVFTDLSLFFNDEDFALYEPYFLYIDQAFVDQLSDAYENDKDLSSIAIPDCTKPDEMDDPIPVFIDMSHCEKLAELYGDSTDTLVFGIIPDAPNQDIILNFLEYLTE